MSIAFRLGPAGRIRETGRLRPTRSRHPISCTIILAVLAYLVRRILMTIPVLLGVATLVFSLIHLVPGDPAQSMLGEGASPEEVASLRHSLGLDRPLLAQYKSFLTGLVKGDLGLSFRYGTPVTREIRDRLFRTAQLAAAAMFVAILCALPLG